MPTAPHTLRSIGRGFADRVLNLERGLLHTAWQLFSAPGRMLREYLAGRTIPYVNPVGYTVVAFGAFALSARLSGGSGGGSDRVFVALMIPFVAMASRVLFLRARFVFAEHLIVATYLCGQVALMLAILQLPLANIARFVASDVTQWLVILLLVFTAGWFCWAYSRLFPGRPLFAAARGLAALAVGAAAWGAAVMLLLRALR